MISHNVEKVRFRISEAARKSGRSDLPRLVGVTKKRSIEEISNLLAAGVHDLGENRWDEWDLKAEVFEKKLTTKISWHFIGGIQKRSLRKYYRPLYRIDSIDTVEHARVVSELADMQGMHQDVLLEINVLREEGRSGFSPDNIESGLEQIALLKGLSVRGVMVMGPIPDVSGDISKTRKVFEEARDLWDRLRKNWPLLEELSMGMSEDFEEGIRCGATEVRIGRLLFEEGDP